MTEAAFFVSGFLACLALCWKRIRESRLAFSAAVELLDVAYEKIAKLEGTLANIRGLAQRMRLNRIPDRTVTLPATVGTEAGQHMGQLSTSAGSSLVRRSRFLGRVTCRSEK